MRRPFNPTCRLSALGLLIAALLLAAPTPAQQVQSRPGQYDYFVLNLSWAPEFCATLDTLTPAEKLARGSAACAIPHGFVLHGLWPQNFNGSYPANCSARPGPTHPERYLDMTPDLSLIRHEWAKHGTCTTFSSDAYFAVARRAFKTVHIPAALLHVDAAQRYVPAVLLELFQTANPSFPAGSFALSCRADTLTAVEACFSRDTAPISCVNLQSCRAPIVKVPRDTDP